MHSAMLDSFCDGNLQHLLSAIFDNEWFENILLEERESYSNSMEDNDGQQFVGSYLPIEDWARRIRHPDRRALKELRVFVGVEGQRFDNLASGRLPARCRSLEYTSDTKEERTQSIPSRTGILPSQEYPGLSRGVFSLLSNGSLLAIEVGP